MSELQSLSSIALDAPATTPPALSAVRRVIDTKVGPVGVYTAGFGRPVLLIHSVNAAASPYEVKPVFEGLAHSHAVYALELPGFELVDRRRRNYTVQLYRDVILAMAAHIRDESGHHAFDALAISLSCEFLARAAVSEPVLFRSLGFVSPTGFQRGGDDLRGRPESTRTIVGLEPFLNLPGLSDGLYAVLSSRKSVRFFLERTFGSKHIDEGLFRYAHLSTRTPGAKHAPLAFLSGKLFSNDIRTVYEALDLPIWFCHGTRGAFSDFSASGWTYTLPNWISEIFETGALPHFEIPQRFCDAYSTFLAQSDAYALA
ncbi:MAG: alpha/beta hydrolase [Beijerinckiaceae bacterium]|nr:alpha/beta hydrolase [Beijerinckiaceae bacterium]